LQQCGISKLGGETGETLTLRAAAPTGNGVAESVVLSLDAVCAGDQGGVCTELMEIMAVLRRPGSAGNCYRRPGQAGVLAAGERGAVASVVDGDLARLAERSLPYGRRHLQAACATSAHGSLIIYR
jgi:hypothetical protein